MIEQSNDELEEVYVSKLNFISKSEEDDPFNIGLDDVRALKGLNRNFIRAADRTVQKKVKTKRIEKEQVLGYSYLECVTPTYNMDYLAKLYDISSAHRSSVNAKTDNIVGLGWDWIETYQTKSLKGKMKSSRKLEILEQKLSDSKNLLNKWLDNVNDECSFEEVLQKIWKDYESTGNAYVEVGRDLTGSIEYIGHIPATTIRVRVNRDGYIQLVGERVCYFRNFGDTNPNPVTNDAQPNEIIHFKKYTPTGNYYGVPDIISAKAALAGNEFASRYNLDYFENKAIPRFVIMAKGGRLSQSSIAQLVEFFETGLRGKHHRSIYIPLPDKDTEIEFQAIEASTQDSSFNEYRKSNNDEIFMAHRTPKSRVGLLDSTGLAAARDADKVFKESVCRPEQRIIEKKINKIFHEKTDMFEFKLSELSLTDEDAQSQIDERRVRMGIDVADEIRARDGKPPRPDGKGGEPWQANSQQAAEQRAQASANRTRDADRSANSPDKSGEGRATQGEGRQQA